MAPAVITVGAQYTGFHSRPTSTGSTYAIKDAAHPSAGDCSQCHTGTNYFSGLVKPNGHIPTTGTCSTCHIVSGDYSIAGLASNAILHTGISSGCTTCHAAGPFAGCATQAGCASPPPLTYQPKKMPLLAGGSPTAPSTATHVPAAGIDCQPCHSKAVFTSFTGMNMKSNAIAHGTVSGATCMSCHEGGYKWFGVTKLVTKGVGHEGRKAGQDCIPCHKSTFTQFVTAARVRPVMRGALNTLSQHVLIDGNPVTAPADGTQVFSHAGVLPGQCQTCHNAMAAKGKPAKHLQTTLSCDSCHRTTAWKPAQFSHEGVQPGQCQACHNPASATGKAAGHFVTVRSCDNCHRTVAWVPVSYQHLSPLYHPQADKSTCLSCHVTNGEIIPRQMRGNNRPKPVPVRTGP
jgi:nitrate/TMAO reductase-like tetraheme cytochrome c subunit